MLVRDALALAADITKEDMPIFCEKWAAWAEARLGEGELRGSTILDYLNPSRYKSRSPVDQEILSKDKRHCTPKIAWNLVEYLDVRAIENAGTRFAIDKNAILNLAQKLEIELKEERAKRSLKALRNDRKYHDVIKRLAGAYSVIRYETGLSEYQYEVLFLDFEGTRQRFTYATYVRPQIAYRGVWQVIDNAIYCTLGGYFLSTGEPKTTSLTICRDNVNRVDIMCGILSGIGTATGSPVVMPFTLFKIPLPPEYLRPLFRLSDARLVDEFSNLKAHINPNDQKFEFIKLLESKLPVTSATSEDFNGVRKFARNNIDLLINPKIQAWCDTAKNYADKPDAPTTLPPA